jgi:hypothetical protein
MARPKAQPRSSSARAAVSGISLLMLVAIAVQASAGLLTPAVQARQHNGLPVVRLIAEAVTRRVERQTRRQEERPAICRAARVTTLKPQSSTPAELASIGPEPRRLMVLLTNLPPPGDAAA